MPIRRALIPIGHDLYGINVFHDGSINTESVTSYILTAKTENNQFDNIYEKNSQHISESQKWLNSPIFPSTEQNFGAQAECKEIDYYKEFTSATRQLNMFNTNKKDLIHKGFEENKKLYPILSGGNAKISRKTVQKKSYFFDSPDNFHSLLIAISHIGVIS